jgi:exodeoxyribonuclease V alpha subunit
MSIAFEDPLSRGLAIGGSGLLRVFNDAGVLEAADVHVATRLTALAGEPDESVALALALAVRAVRNGSVCVNLRSVAADAGADAAGLPWPEATEWLAALGDSALVGSPPIVQLYGDLVYLDRYWREEQQVCADLLARPAADESVDTTALRARLDRVFHRPGSGEQRAAAEIALSHSTTVLTGGPGTGKTTTVAGLLALLTEQATSAGGPALRIALAAPTGKAAARLQEAVREEVANLDEADQARLSGLRAVTLHRLLGARPDTAVRFRHHRGNRFPHDVIVVDETSMVSLTMMARLLEAVRPQTRLILVGDPDQLASVEAGAVLADLVDGLGGQAAVGRGIRIAELTTSHRFGESIGRLAEAIRTGDADLVMELLAAGGEHIEFIDNADSPASTAGRLRDVLVPHALRVRQAAALGNGPAALATLDEHRLLCAHRDGPYGVRAWNRNVERWLTEETGEANWSQWYLGRPVLVTANDYGLGLYNGDTGVTVLDGDSLRVMIGSASGPTDFATSRLAEVETMHAMTIHKSQGSQAAVVTVLLPSEDSRLLTRELLYTAVTRAKSKIRVVGAEAEVRAALARRVVRATGLRLRLQQLP